MKNLIIGLVILALAPTACGQTTQTRQVDDPYAADFCVQQTSKLMYISLLQQNKKNRNSLHFKRRVVECFRAETVEAADIAQYLHIDQTQLRRLN